MIYLNGILQYRRLISYQNFFKRKQLKIQILKVNIFHKYHHVFLKIMGQFFIKNLLGKEVQMIWLQV
jgi:hypothetical protein